MNLHSRFHYSLSVPAKPGDVVYRIIHNSNLPGGYKYVKCEVTELIINQSGITIVSRLLNSFVNTHYTDTLEHFLQVTERTEAEAKLRVSHNQTNSQQPSI